MLIGIDATPAIKRLGGVTEYTRQLLTHLGATDHDNFYRLVTFSLFRSQTQKLPKLPANFKERAVPLPGRVVDRMWRKAGIPPLEPFIGRPDLLFFPNIFTPYTLTPTVITVHDLSWLLFPEMAPDGEVDEFRSCLMRAVRTAKKVIAVSEATKRDLVRVADIPEEKIVVIYEGYDETLRKKPSNDALHAFRERCGLGDDPYFLHVGTLEPRKNLARLIGAFDRFKLTSKLPHRLVLLGRFGWKDEVIRAAIGQSPHKDAIHTPGPLPDDDRRLAYWAADAVVFPSLYEGFGIPVLEGQAAEKPVLTGDGGSLPEVTDSSSLVVDVNNEQAIAEGLHKLATATSLRHDLIRRGLVNIKRFSWQKMARETKALFEEVGQ